MKGVTESLGADVLVIFGITGDLAHAMTFHALYRLEAAGQLACPIIGVAKDSWSSEQLLDSIAATVRKSGEEPQPAVIDRLASRLSYLEGNFTDPALYTDLAARLTGSSRPLFYLEMIRANIAALSVLLLDDRGRARVTVHPAGDFLASGELLGPVSEGVRHLSVRAGYGTTRVPGGACRSSRGRPSSVLRVCRG